MRFSPAKLISGLVAANLMVAFSGVAAGADTSVVDVSAPMVANLASCQTPDELDCIAGLAVVNSDGSTTPLDPATFTGANTVVDVNGNTLHQGQQNFSGAGVNASVTAELESPAHLINLSPKVEGSALRVWISGGTPDTKFEVKVRTSWLRAEDIQLLAKSAAYQIENISGGTLWTFSGSQQVVGGYTSDWQSKMAADANADVVGSRLVFFVHHAGADASSSYFDPRCATTGFPVRTFNAPAAGLPYWDAATQSLNFGIWSPHADPNGTPFVGYFKIWVPDSYIDCMYPDNTITKAASITAAVVDADGYAQDASVQISNENGNLYLSVSGFHYSSPKISIRDAALVGPKVKPVVKKITCFKGSRTKSVSGVKPVCPAGYKAAKTIRCAKGSRVKTVTALSPRCPAGYRKKP